MYNLANMLHKTKLEIGKFLGCLITAGVILGVSSGSSFGCSRILLNTNGKGVFVSRSMDWAELMAPQLIMVSRGMSMSGALDQNAAKWTSKYGSVVIEVSNYDNAGVDGMNEKGLTAHLLYLEATKYEDRDQRPGVSYLHLLRYVLDDAATVSEALSGLERIQIVPVPIHGTILGAHMAVEDSSGDSAIIEFIDGKMVVHHGRQYCIMTNDPPYDIAIKVAKEYQGLGGTKELPGNVESIERFIRAAYYLKYLPEPKDHAQGIAFVYNLIHNVAVPRGAPYSGNAGIYPTWWFTAGDLTDKVYYFNMADNPNLIWIDVGSLNFSEGQPVMTLDPKNPALVGDVSRGFQSIAQK